MFREIRGLYSLGRNKYTAIVIPWRETESRIPLKNYVVSWYEYNFPNSPIYLTDSGHQPFSVSASRNIGVELASEYEVVIVSDADTIPQYEKLIKASNFSIELGSAVFPYKEYRKLNKTKTQRFLRGDKTALQEYTLNTDFYGGVFVTTPATWLRHGGQDEKFMGWGMEDVAWQIAHEAFVGIPPLKISGHVYSLYHEPAAKTGISAKNNSRLLKMYNKYRNNKKELYSLISSEVSDVLL